MPGFDPHPDSPITLGLSQPPATPVEQPLPSVDELQFRHAQTGEGRSCAACNVAIEQEFFQVNGKDICADCAEKIRAGQKAPRYIPWFRAVLYGGGAGLAGCAIYAMVAVITGLEIGLIAILVGIMVGKAIRLACYGVGGRPQQILAVALTYFAITTSYIPVFIYDAVKHPIKQEQKAPATQSEEPTSVGTALFSIFLLAAAAPFLSLFSGGNPISGLISLFIIYIGLQRAWALTARPDILVTGPYPCSLTSP
jgi:hypothetical protein